MIDISVSNLVKEFEVGKKILDGLTFQVDQGERVGLLGKNGAGKTTLFKMLTGELDWDEGEIHIAPGTVSYTHLDVYKRQVMDAAGLEALEGVERTGFADDEAIETWAKPYVSSALKSGLIQGSLDESGQAVFRGSETVTAAEAAVLLDRALQITDVDAQTFASADAPAWACLLYTSRCV